MFERGCVTVTKRVVTSIVIMNIYKKVGQKAKKAYQNWASKQPYQILDEHENSIFKNYEKDGCCDDSEGEWGERRSRLDASSEGKEVSQNELIFMTGFLAAQEEQEKEEVRKQFGKQQSVFSKRS